MEHPIAENENARFALELCRQVADSLRTAVPLATAKWWERALFWGYWSSYTDAEQDAEAARISLSHAVAEAEAALVAPIPQFQLIGSGFALSHLLLDDAPSLLRRLDDQLMRWMADESFPKDLGILKGLAGIAIYANERRLAGDAQFAQQCLEPIWQYLQKTVSIEGANYFWVTPQAALPAWLKSRYPSGHVNCGLAHGVPGILVALDHINTAGIADTSVYARGVLSWLDSIARDDSPETKYPQLLVGNRAVGDPRTAWCYGDFGVATARWRTCIALKLPTRAVHAEALAAAARRLELTRVKDAGICHGAIGNALMCKQFFHASSDEAFSDLATSWLMRAHAYHQPNLPYGGFGAYGGDEESLENGGFFRLTLL
ncbi:MAG: hypothetical protein IPL79_17590 [Myxococcales bacterium]|nr:hypothetical protein [Myxococcales bacterium]